MTNQQFSRHQIGDLKFTTFPFDKFGIMGVGKNRTPIINMDKYITHANDEELHLECCSGLAQVKDYGTGMLIGALPPHVTERFNGLTSWSEMLTSDWFKSIDHDRKHTKIISKLSVGPDGYSNVNKYCYYALGSVIPWFFTYYLKTNDFTTKSKEISEWKPEAYSLFPNVIEYIKTLPFKEIGRVLFFATYPGAGVVTHRDSPVVEHSDHNINLFFGGGSRPNYVWDEIKDEKIYLQSGARSYFFNNRDYHGVDPETRFRYTLRIDGTFTNELCEELRLIDGQTWSWNYYND